MKLKGSWRSTCIGVSMVVTAIAGAVIAFCDDDPQTVINATALIEAIQGGLAMFVVRDNRVTSEEAGAKK